MSQIRKAVLSGTRFLINGNAEYVFRIVAANDLQLEINGKMMEAVVVLSYKNLNISILYAGLVLSTEVRLRDLLFVPIL